MYFSLNVEIRWCVAKGPQDLMRFLKYNLDARKISTIAWFGRVDLVKM